MSKYDEQNQEACNLDMPNGLHGDRDYNKHFVRAKNLDNFPCNYAAEKVSPEEVMRKTHGR